MLAFVKLLLAIKQPRGIFTLVLSVSLALVGYKSAPRDLWPFIFLSAVAYFCLGILISSSAQRFSQTKKYSASELVRLKELDRLMETAAQLHDHVHQLKANVSHIDQNLHQLGNNNAKLSVAAEQVLNMKDALVDFGRHLEAIDCLLRSEPWVAEAHSDYRLLSHLASDHGAGQSAQIAIQRVEIAFADLELKQQEFNEDCQKKHERLLDVEEKISSAIARLSEISGRLNLLDDGIVANGADLERLLRAVNDRQVLSTHANSGEVGMRKNCLDRSTA